MTSIGKPLRKINVEPVELPEPLRKPRVPELPEQLPATAPTQPEKEPISVGRRS